MSVTPFATLPVLDELAATALIVTYNSAGHIADCVRSCIAQGLQVVVFDNASQDSTVREVPEHELVTVIRNPRNAGFAGGVNGAVRASRTELLLLLNPDAVLMNSIQPLARYVAEAPLRAAAGLLVDASGEAQAGFSVRRFPSAASLAFHALGIHALLPKNALNRHGRYEDLDYSKTQDVEQPAGACLLFRKDDWERLGGFDEDFYPLWFEDVDFCKRLKDRGASIRLDPSVRVRHTGAHSIRALDFAKRQRFWHISMLTYAVKHFDAGGRRMVATAVLAAAPLRAAASLLFDSPGAVAREFSGVIGAAWRVLWGGQVRGAA